MKLSRTHVRVIRTLLAHTPSRHGMKMNFYSMIADMFDVSRAYVIDLKRGRARQGIKPFAK